MRDIKKIINVIYLLGSLAMIGTAGILAVLHFGDEVIPYVPLVVSLLAVTMVVFIVIVVRLVRGKKVKRWASIPANAWAVFVIVVAIVGMVFTAPSLYKRSFISTAPYLTWTGDQDPSTGITVCWVSTFPSDSVVRYGTDPANLANTATGAGGSKYHHVALSGLVPNTTYYYTAGGSPVKQFTTAPEGTFNFTFYVWSDPRQNNDYYTALGRPNTPYYMYQHAMAVGDDVAFSICTGDITSTANDYDTWDLWFQDISTNDWAVNRSHAVAFGNHERHGDWEGNTLQLFYPQEKRADGRFWYSFNYSNVHFIMLDTYEQHASWMANFTQEHLDWLEADLAASASMPFKLAFMHPPALNGQGVQEDIERLAEQYNIQLFMTGHRHRYNRTTAAYGTHYVIQGIGGNANNVFRDLECNTAFTIIRVKGDTIDVEVTWINGTVLDQFSITA